jgi:hypothetical protein
MTPQLRDHFTDALVAMCALELENRNRRALEPRSNRPIKLMSMVDLSKQIEEEPYEQAISDPVWFAARAGTKRIGAAIHRNGGFEAMEKVLYAAADQMDQGGQVLSFVDHAWSGIGEWMS